MPGICTLTFDFLAFLILAFLILAFFIQSALSNRWWHHGIATGPKDPVTAKARPKGSASRGVACQQAQIPADVYM
jgi:hypothetical protein